MTASQAVELDKAMRRAENAGLRVVAHGTRKSDGVVVYAVPSQRVANRWYLVAVIGNRLACDCQAGKLGRVCAHRACVHTYLLASLQAARRMELERKESAPVYRDNRPVSMWK